MIIHKEIQGLSSYLISSDGTITRKDTNKSLHPYTSKSCRYLMIKLTTDTGKRRMYMVHKLIATAFIPNPNSMPEVNHKDRDPLNNNIDNLEWCTRKYNMEYSHILDNPVKNHYSCKLMFGEKEIKRFDSLKDAAKYASAQFNVSYSSSIKYKMIKGTALKILPECEHQKYAKRNIRNENGGNRIETSVYNKNHELVGICKSKRSAAIYASIHCGAKRVMLEHGYSSNGYYLKPSNYTPRNKYANATLKV